MDFTHLHLHSQYSLLDGMIRFPELCDHLSQNNMKAVALTDHGVMMGILSFYKECRKHGIKPILGVEAYLTFDEDNSEEKHRDNLHSVLLAKDYEGYKTLLRLSSEAALRNFYYKPRIHIQKLRQASGHVICTTACLAGPIASLAEFDEETKQFRNIDAAEATVLLLKDIFPQGDFFLEVQPWEDGRGEQTALNDLARELGEKHDIPLVATCDSHYLRREDHELHEMMIAMQLKMTLEEYRAQDTMRYGNFFWVRTREEMEESCRKHDILAAAEKTVEIAARCNVEIPLGEVHMPVIGLEEREDRVQFAQWSKSQQAWSRASTTSS